MNRDVKLGLFFAVIGALLGGLSSYYVSLYFADKARDEAVANAVDEGRNVGFAEGILEANRQFDEIAPTQLEEKFPSIFDSARQDARMAGFAAGEQEGRRLACGAATPSIRREGYDEGFNTGFQDGVERGKTECVLEQIGEAERLEDSMNNWHSYRQLLQRLSDAAESLERNPGSEEIQAELLSIASATVEVAGALERAYSDQADSFNSTMDDLRGALEKRNMPEIRRLGRSLFEGSESKGFLFISGRRDAIQAFMSISQ